MPNQTTALALAPPAEALYELEYQALVSALSESARGRAFLAEHARRTRAADTSALRAALDRIESLVRAQNAPSAAQPARMELQALLDDLRAARPAVETGPLTTKVAQLAALLDLMESRLTDLLASAFELVDINDTAPEQLPAPHADIAPRARWSDAPPEALTAESDAMLSRPDEKLSSVTLRCSAEGRATASRLLPTYASKFQSRVNPRLVGDGPGPSSFEAHSLRSLAPQDDGERLSSASISGSDALALIMALSEEERIALFT